MEDKEAKKEEEDDTTTTTITEHPRSWSNTQN